MKQQSLLLTALGGYMAHLGSHSEASGGMRRGGGWERVDTHSGLVAALLLWSVVGGL